MATKFHVVDDNHRRRAQISRELMSRGLHAEIYDDISEFRRAAPRSGVLLASDSAFIETRAAGELGMPVALYSEQPNTQEIVDAISAGVVDYLPWPISVAALDGLQKRLARGGHHAADMLKRAQAQACVKMLTAREVEVLVLILHGGSSKSIGEDLGISSRTVEIHRANIMRKLGAQSVADAVRIAIHAGLDDEPDWR